MSGLLYNMLAVVCKFGFRFGESLSQA